MATPLPPEPPASLRDVAVDKLTALAAALRLPADETARAVRTFELLSEPWAAEPVGEKPPWDNDITDDGTPFEFSVALEPNVVELRMLLESQLPRVSPNSSWEAGLRLQHRLAAAKKASLSRFDAVADLFAPPEEGTVRFSLWHAAVLRPGAEPLLKAYLNPRVAGDEAALETVARALRRLGLESARRFLEERVEAAASPSDVAYFSLDLRDDTFARAKVYVATREPASVEALLEGVRNFSPGEASGWLESLTGRVTEYAERPVLVCFAFTGDGGAPNATLHVPVRCYVRSDAQAARRMSSLLDAGGRATLNRVLAAATERPLDAGRGLISYASLRPTNEGLRVTAYLAPQVYAIAAPRRGRTSTLPPSATGWDVDFEVVRSAIDDEVERLLEHRFVQRLQQQDTADLGAVLPRLALVGSFALDVGRIARQKLQDSLISQLEAPATMQRLVDRLRQEVETQRLPSFRGQRWPFASHDDFARDWAYERLRDILIACEQRELVTMLVAFEAVMLALLELVEAGLDASLSRQAGHADEQGTHSGYLRVQSRKAWPTFDVSRSSLARLRGVVSNMGRAGLELLAGLEAIADAERHGLEHSGGLRRNGS